MPKHLYTIPSGDTLPSPTDFPEGYPFLLVSDEAVPGQLHCLQDGVFQRMVPDAPAAVVTGTRTPVIFVGQVPVSAAGTTVACAYQGVPAGRFIMPAGLASGGVNNGQLREVTISATAAPNDMIHLVLGVTDPGGIGATWNPWTSGGWPAGSPGINGTDRMVREIDYDPASQPLSVGYGVTMGLAVGASYTASADNFVIVTLWFGEVDVPGGADTLSAPGRLGRNAELTQREAELQGETPAG